MADLPPLQFDKLQEYRQNALHSLPVGGALGDALDALLNGVQRPGNGWATGGQRLDRRV